MFFVRLWLVLFLALFSTLALAAFVGPEHTKFSNVKEIQTNPRHKAFFILKGKILKRLSVDKYVFTDEAGTEIIVEIESRKFPSSPDVTPNDLVTIKGEIEVKGPKVELEADSIEFAK